MREPRSMKQSEQRALGKTIKNGHLKKETEGRGASKEQREGRYIREIKANPGASCDTTTISKRILHDWKCNSLSFLFVKLNYSSHIILSLFYVYNIVI